MSFKQHPTAHSLVVCEACGKPIRKTQIGIHRCASAAEVRKMIRQSNDDHRLRNDRQLDYYAQYADPDR